MSNIDKNSEILFIYDAKLCNPNGDMDDENKPRMDYDTSTNLVSDVRLKRYIRDYYEKILGQSIFVTENAKDAKDRGEKLKKEKKDPKDLIDCKLFGAVLAQKGDNDHIIGPIQFNWGYSLNKVELNESVTITSSFKSGEGIGKDFRVKYSLIAFNGGINARVVESQRTKLNLTEADIKGFDQAIIQAIPLNRTRTKIGQTPRIYVRIEMKNKNVVLKDLREYLSIKQNDNINNEYDIRDIGDFVIDFTKLNDYLEKNILFINKIFYWVDENVKGFEIFKDKFKNILEEIKVEEIKIENNNTLL
ncbi:MAG: type I-B CRISPR-associated protein Cas7/Csh2 [Elusimicrobiota bacterium]|nr:type I-B CRISPR-associated protein Cas7/Csh2 [Elusimicrobiota bacterium]